MLPPRYWPTGLWVAAGAVVLLVAHAIGLAVQLLLIESGGGRPADSESYLGQTITGFVPALAVLIVGLYSSISAARSQQEGITMWGRVFLAALGVVTVALVGLGVPVIGLGR